ncbi:hypothetical protein F2Q70_00024582 [Brassica cretica]|uniref:Uncharacterized protein n=1 Tax=Brassica cretica TaxID=69181 RepID=A0A8S9LB99_BRACR|nr:hypothetical protein F2Q70_00024582 [Brassica cretica]
MKPRVDGEVKDLNRRSDIAGENDATKPPNPGDKAGEAGAMEATIGGTDATPEAGAGRKHRNRKAKNIRLFLPPNNLQTF